MGETTMRHVENALIEASNRLHEIDSKKDPIRFAVLDKAIDTALRLVQAWIEAETA